MRNVSVFVVGGAVVAHIVPTEGGFRRAPVTGPRVATVFASPAAAVVGLGAGSLIVEEVHLGLVAA